MTKRHAALLALGFVSVVWAGGFVAASAAVGSRGGFGPLWLTGVRLVLAGALLLAAAGWLDLALPRTDELPSIALSGALAWIGGSGLQTIGQQSVPAGTAALVLGASPLVALGMTSALSRTLPGPRDLLVVALGLAGLAIAVGPSGAGAGLGFVAGACVCWTASSVIEARRPATGAHPLATGALQMLAGGFGTSALAAAVAEPLPQPSAIGLLGFAWLSLACAGVGMPLWLWLLRTLPVPVAMTQATLTPIAAALLSAWLLDEPVGPGTVIGGALVLGSAWLAVRRTEAPEPGPEGVPAPRRVRARAHAR